LRWTLIAGERVACQVLGAASASLHRDPVPRPWIQAFWTAAWRVHKLVELPRLMSITDLLKKGHGLAFGN
jgi:hypothetical protein